MAKKILFLLTMVFYVFLGGKITYDPGVDFENEKLFESSFTNF